MKKCIFCGANLDNHPRRKVCEKKSCQKKRLSLNSKKYYAKKKTLPK